MFTHARRWRRERQAGRRSAPRSDAIRPLFRPRRTPRIGCEPAPRRGDPPSVGRFIVRFGPLLVLALPALAARAAFAGDAAPLRLFAPPPATGLVARASYPGTVRRSVDRAALDGLRNASTARVVLPLPDGREA